MSTLTDFLLARIAETEAYIDPDGTTRAALREDGWVAPQLMWSHDGLDGADRLILAEYESKRRTIRNHCGWHSCGANHYGIRYDTDVDDDCDWGNCPTVLALALPYSTHPDFDKAWRL